jgi:hypothetical protein
VSASIATETGPIARALTSADGLLAVTSTYPLEFTTPFVLAYLHVPYLAV